MWITNENIVDNVEKCVESFNNSHFIVNKNVDKKRTRIEYISSPFTLIRRC